MLRLKRRWDEQYPEKNHISTQNLRDNPARLKKESKKNFGNEETQIKTEEYTTLSKTNKQASEMKVKLLKTEDCERNRDRRFTRKGKEAWDNGHVDSV